METGFFNVEQPQPMHYTVHRIWLNMERKLSNRQGRCLSQDKAVLKPLEQLNIAILDIFTAFPDQDSRRVRVAARKKGIGRGNKKGPGRWAASGPGVTVGTFSPGP